MHVLKISQSTTALLKLLWLVKVSQAMIKSQSWKSTNQWQSHVKQWPISKCLSHFLCSDTERQPDNTSLISVTMLPQLEVLYSLKTPSSESLPISETQTSQNLTYRYLWFVHRDNALQVLTHLQVNWKFTFLHQIVWYSVCKFTNFSTAEPLFMIT